MKAMHGEHTWRHGGLLPRRVMAVAMVLALAPAVPATAEGGKDRYREHPGFVDGSRFVELAEPNGQLVEITLHGRLLHLLGDRAVRRHDATLAEILGGLVSMQAVIATIPDDVQAEQQVRARARERVEEVGRRLLHYEWERFVRVRESDSEEILAYAHLSADGEIDGLVVMGTTGGGEVLFVNLAGHIDMAAVAILGDRFGVPGLDELPGEAEVKHRYHERREASRADQDNERGGK